MPNLIYRALGTPVTFRDSAGDAVITLNNLAFGAGRISAQYDRGTGSKPQVHMWRGVFQFNTAPAVGELVELYISESDGTYQDGVLGASDAALTTDKRRNLKYIGAVVADTTSTATNIIGSGYCLITERYFSVGVWNGSAGDNLQATANASRVIFTSVAQEIQ